MKDISSPAIIVVGAEIHLWQGLEYHRLGSITEIVDGGTAQETIGIIIGRRICEYGYFVIRIAAEKLKQAIAEIQIHVSKRLVAWKAIAITIRIQIIAAVNPFGPSIEWQVPRPHGEMIERLKRGQY